MKKLLLILFAFSIQHSAFSITPIFTCGGDCGRSAIHFTTVTSASFSSTQKRSGSLSLRCNPSAGAGGFTSPTFSSSAVWVVRFYVYYASLPTDNNATMFNMLGGLACIRYKTADGKFYAAGNTIESGASGATLSTATWYKIDLKVDATNNPWTIDMSVNGAAFGQATHAAAGTTATAFGLGAASGATSTFDAYYDDILVSNTSGDFPLSAGTTYTYLPTSDGTHNVAGANDFEFSGTGTDITNATTTAYTLLNDVPVDNSLSAYINLIAPPNATDYVEVIYGAGTGFSTATVAPNFASVIVVVSEASSGVNNIRIAINDNGTLDDVYNTDPSGTVTTVKNYTDPPSAATSWTLSGNGNFNNLRVRCFTSDAAPDPYFLSTLIEANIDDVSLTVPGTPSDKRHTTLGVGMIALNTTFKNHFSK